MNEQEQEQELRLKKEANELKKFIVITAQVILLLSLFLLVWFSISTFVGGVFH